MNEFPAFSVFGLIISSQYENVKHYSIEFIDFFIFYCQNLFFFIVFYRIFLLIDSIEKIQDAVILFNNDGVREKLPRNQRGEDMKKGTLMELAYQCILQKIIKEHLAPGTPLRESHLAKEFNLSPTPVREAFRRLENEGWLQSHPYKGCALRQYTLKELEEMFLLREALEEVAVKCAVQRATPTDLRNLENVLKKEREFIDMRREKNPEPAMESPTSIDILFHDALVTAAHTPHLKQRNSMLQTQISYAILLNAGTPTTPDDLESVYEEHCMVFFAIRRGWEDIAEALIRRHIHSGWNKYLRSLKEKKDRDVMLPNKTRKT